MEGAVRRTGGPENRYEGQLSSWVRIPRPPLNQRRRHLTSAYALSEGSSRVQQGPAGSSRVRPSPAPRGQTVGGPRHDYPAATQVSGEVAIAQRTTSVTYVAIAMASRTSPGCQWLAAQDRSKITINEGLEDLRSQPSPSTRSQGVEPPTV